MLEKIFINHSKKLNYLFSVQKINIITLSSHEVMKEILAKNVEVRVIIARSVINKNVILLNNEYLWYLSTFFFFKQNCLLSPYGLKWQEQNTLAQGISQISLLPSLIYVYFNLFQKEIHFIWHAFFFTKCFCMFQYIVVFQIKQFCVFFLFLKVVYFQGIILSLIFCQ